MSTTRGISCKEGLSEATASSYCSWEGRESLLQIIIDQHSHGMSSLWVKPASNDLMSPFMSSRSDSSLLLRDSDSTNILQGLLIIYWSVFVQRCDSSIASFGKVSCARPVECDSPNTGRVCMVNCEERVASFLPYVRRKFLASGAQCTGTGTSNSSTRTPQRQ